MRRLPLFRPVSAGLSLLAVLLAFGAAPATAQMQPPQDTTQVTFDEAVRTALDQNTNIKRAQAQARQSNVQVRSEWMDFAPNLSIDSDVTRRVGRNFSQVTGDFTTQSTDFFNLSGRSSITLFNGFENISSLRGAREQAGADQTNLKRTRREVVFDVMDQFISLVESREIVRVRREQVAAQRQRLRQIEQFVEAGSRPESDLFTAEADLADAEQQLLQGKREREVTQTRLIQTLQLNPREAYDFRVPDLEGATLDSSRQELPALIDEAFQKRLDLRVAEAERRAAEQGVRSARSAYYPTLSLSGSYGTDWSSQGVRGNVSDDFTNQLDVNRGGGLSLSISIPIFDRLQRSNQVEQAQVQAQDAEYALQDQRQEIALQVRQSYLDYRNAVQQLEAANKRLRAAERARTAAQERYELGSADIVELQNAIRDYVDAASQQVRARYELFFQQKRIDYNVGRLSPSAPLLGAPAKP
ncbi:TolC family protein [Salinibacter ruber]|uniref:TolC family protein n=1 Tax=Salinibacter ruber TaxID=146919 RepID=UPI000E58082B|nr:TolC family protein [Salinibacter ruber]MCS3649853.1 outer membrane protein [Salinibacter ruber]MCS3653107.1 outer membrane protein [Salinibacter ruber]MCS3757778.1 outer membrane protein [Salinibacter ruber]MCS3861240.1 outer membrane protein [Salinibacter ruber]MCS3954432.1 outer membrane protein [Salinibacter ruber]